MPPDSSNQTPLDVEVKAPESDSTKLVQAESNTDSDEAEDLDLFSLVGQTIQAKYEILELAGRGGMGAVYKARHKDIKRIVAIKVLLKHHVFNPETKARFREEATNAGKLNHPNLIAVHDFGFLPGRQPYIVMDYLHGRGLDDVILSDCKLPLEQFLSIFEQVCKGLSHAHGHGLVHRDIKPSNIMLVPGDDGEQVVKIVDFGIAKVYLPGLESTDQPRKFTKSGSVCGSPLYMSPENCREKPLDQRSDIYSLGCVMYEVLTRTPPLQADTAMDTMVKQIRQMPLRFSELPINPNVSPELEAMVFKCLAKDPSERYQSAEQLKLQIKKLQAPKKRNKTTEQDISSARGRTPSRPISQAEAATAIATTPQEAPKKEEPPTWTSAAPEDDDKQPSAPAQDVNRLASELVGYIVSAGVCTAIGIACIQQHYHLKELGVQSRTWVQTSGILRRAPRSEGQTGVSALLQPAMALGDGFYEYTYNGRQYVSTRFSLYESRSGDSSKSKSTLWELYGSGPEGAQYRKEVFERGTRANQNPTGTGMNEVTSWSQALLGGQPFEPIRQEAPIQLTVHVDPKNPSSATIVNGVGGDRLLFWFGTLSVVGSIFVLALVAIRCSLQKPVISGPAAIIGAVRALIVPWLAAIILGGSLLIAYTFYFTNSKIFYNF